MVERACPTTKHSSWALEIGIQIFWHMHNVIRMSEVIMGAYTMQRYELGTYGNHQEFEGYHSNQVWTSCLHMRKDRVIIYSWHGSGLPWE